jgi:hypothetical protein
MHAMVVFIICFHTWADGGAGRSAINKGKGNGNARDRPRERVGRCLSNFPIRL